MTLEYPTSFNDLRFWAHAADVPVSEARIRFAQYAVLRSIAVVRSLQEGLVFKGGNALDFIWQPNRSTRDLDFSIDHDSALATPDVRTIRTLLERGAPVTNTNLGVWLAIQRIRENPPGADRDFVTFQARIGYALPDQVRLRQRMERGEQSAQGVDLDISINEPIGDARLVEMSSGLHLRVATIEDIVAEKLRALLQQPIRNRHRRQDLLDIAVILQENTSLDHRLVAEFLLRKAAARAVPVSRTAFKNPEVVSRANSDYANLEQTTRRLFIPFNDALMLLHAFVDGLNIPD